MEQVNIVPSFCMKLGAESEGGWDVGRPWEREGMTVSEVRRVK